MTQNADALTASGRLAPMSSINQHQQLVTAEQNLLKSLAREKVSNALSPVKKIQLRDPNDPTFQPAMFGEGLAEVRDFLPKWPKFVFSRSSSSSSSSSSLCPEEKTSSHHLRLSCSLCPSPFFLPTTYSTFALLSILFPLLLFFSSSSSALLTNPTPCRCAISPMTVRAVEASPSAWLALL